MEQERQTHSLVNSGTKSASEAEISSSAPYEAPHGDERDERASPDGDAIALPAHVAGSGSLERLVDTARDYARAAASDNTLKAYAKDWAQRGFTLDRKNRHIATVLAGIKRKHARPPVQKEAILAEDIQAMVATLPYDLRGLRDRAILLIGYAGGLRRSEIVSLDHGKDDTPDSGGWIEIMDDGAVLTLNAKTGWREVEIGRGSSDQTCPVHALEQWLHFAKLDFGPVFVRTSRDGNKALDARLSDKHVARLIKHTVL
ncbi:hypothetical protein LCGC14_1979930, partial [marine sediment metagenome]